VKSAVELGVGMYNSTYRVEIARTEPVILRVVPEPDRQFRSERELMRNEHASVPWLSVIALLMPRVIAADWSHEVIGRDYAGTTWCRAWWRVSRRPSPRFGARNPDGALCLPKSTSAQVRALMSGGWRRRLGTVTGHATTLPSPRGDGRLCCCDWLTGPSRTRSRCCGYFR
jgi:hypothetical protein